MGCYTLGQHPRKQTSEERDIRMSDKLTEPSRTKGERPPVVWKETEMWLAVASRTKFMWLQTHSLILRKVEGVVASWKAHLLFS
jgi:hypothetical protein